MRAQTITTAPVFTVPVATRGTSRARKPKSALSVISKSVQPIASDADVELELDRLQARSDVRGMIALYDAYVTAADAFLQIQNMPKAEGVSDFIEEERCHLWSKAYAVADRMKRLVPEKYDKEAHARALFTCALEMGNGLEAAVAVVNELSGGTR